MAALLVSLLTQGPQPHRQASFFLADGLSDNHSTTMVYGLNALHITIRKVDLLEPFRGSISRIEGDGPPEGIY